jgi:RNA polymerase sigma factor (sigma-70 family)
LLVVCAAIIKVGTAPHHPENTIMVKSHPNPFVHQIRQLIGSEPTAELTDDRLLERFLSNGDEAAAEVLVRRYGPLVFGVCRRVLHNSHAAEDVFQATFLALVRKAPSLVRDGRLGGFLYRVASRLALRARANEARRRQREARAARSRPDGECQVRGPSDLEVTLEEELDRLPQRHRAPLVLCYLEGKTNEQAAQILGCPRGSMAARLEQARERLRQALARRGYAVPVAAIATLLAATAVAAPPLPLLSNTVRAAVWFAGGQAAGVGFLSAGAAALARGACRAMFLGKVKVAAAALLAVALLGAGATMLLRAAPPSPATPNASRPATDAPEEQLPRGAVAQLGTTKLRHGGAVTFAAYRLNGKRLLTAGKDGTIRLWDLATGKEVRRFDWPDGPQGNKNEEAEAGTFWKSQQQTVEEIGLSRRFALSANGELVAASLGGVVRVWETASGKSRRTFQTGEKRLIQLAFAADGKSLYTLAPGGHGAAVWEVTTGRRLRRSPGKLAVNFYPVGGVNEIEDQYALVSPGWKYLAYLRRDTSANRWIHLMDLATGKELSRIDAGAFGGPQGFCFSADGRALVWDHMKGRGIVVSDVVTGKELRRLGGHGPRYRDTPFDPAAAIACSPDGKKIAVCRWSHTIELWDLASGKRTDPVGKPTRTQAREYVLDSLGVRAPSALAFSRDGTKLVSSLGGAAVRQFHTDTGREIPGPGNGHRAPVSVLALSADGKSLCTWRPGDPARCWDWRIGKGRSQPGIPANATHAVFAGGGRFAFAVGEQITLGGSAGKKTWKIPDGRRPPLAALALSPDGNLVATQTIGTDEVHLWDADGKPRQTLGRADGPAFWGPGVTEATGVVTQDLVFSPDGRFLAGAGPRRQLCLWDVTTGSLLWMLPGEAGQAIERFAFSPNGNVLAAINADRTITLFEAWTGAERARLGEADLTNRRVHLVYMEGDRVTPVETRWPTTACLAFSPDGRHLAMSKDRPSIHLWDVFAGREVARLKGHEGGVVGLLFGVDGKHLFSGGADTTVLTWDLTGLDEPRPGRAPRLQPRVRETLWTDLAGKDASLAFAALRKLCACPEQAVSLIKERVRPQKPADPGRLERLLADLRSDRFGRRQRAQSELARLGGLAEPVLRKALLDDPPLGVRQRLERLLTLLRQPPPGGPLRELRAVEVLELIGSPAARQVLKTLAGGAPDARLTREARRASRRLFERADKP